MRSALTIAGRELRLYFLSPVGYVIMLLFLLATGLTYYLALFKTGEAASMRPIFALGTFLLVVLGPAITMRTFSDEIRSGTLEMLMTAPMSGWPIVAGKFIAAMGFLIALLIPTFLYVVAMEMYGRPDYGEVGSGYLGMLVAGAAFLASGIFASSLTASQAVAYLLTFFFWVLLILLASLLPLWDVAREHIGAGWLDSLFALSPAPRLGDFATGLIDTANVVYFLSFTIVFLIAANKSLEVRRWA